MNKSEKEIYDRLIEDGYEVYHKGYPDFLAYNQKTGEILFVEVKREYQRKEKRGGLDKSQAKVLQILSQFHPVRIEYVPNKKPPTIKERQGQRAINEQVYYSKGCFKNKL